MMKVLKSLFILFGVSDVFCWLCVCWIMVLVFCLIILCILLIRIGLRLCGRMMVFNVCIRFGVVFISVLLRLKVIDVFLKIVLESGIYVFFGISFVFVCWICLYCWF